MPNSQNINLEHSVNVLIESSLWSQQSLNYSELLLKTINLTLQQELVAGVAEINIKLTDDVSVQLLNTQFRCQNKPTNILSFPADNEDGFNLFFDENYQSLGDLALAYETIEREAREQNITFHDHLVHLLVHGTLHLLGYDHITDEEAEEMESIEVKILSLLGIANPY